VRIAGGAGGGLGLVETLQIVAGRGCQAQLVADEIVKNGAGVAAYGAVGFVGNDQIEVGGRKKLLVFVVEQQGLDRRHHNLGAPPVVAVLFVDDGLEVRRKHRRKRLLGLVFQLQAIHQKEHAPGIAGAQEQLDDGGGGQGFAGAGGHLKQKSVFAFIHSALQRMDGAQLIGAQKPQLVGLDVAGALGFVLPRRLKRIVGPLGQHGVVALDQLVDQPLRVGYHLLVARHRRWRRE
jgi:hypothetical protein